MAKTLFCAPDGEYAVIQFDTAPTSKAKAMETVTMRIDGGKWKSAGYFIN